MSQRDEDPAIASGAAMKQSTAGARSELGVGFWVTAGFGLLAAGGGLAFSAAYYGGVSFLVRSNPDGSVAHFHWGFLLAAIEMFASPLVWTAAGAGVWLAALAIIARRVEARWSGWPYGEPARDGEATADGRSRRVGALIFTAVTFAAGAFAYLRLERDRRWTEWAALGTVAAAGWFGARRAHSHVRVARVPGLVVPVLLGASGFLLGAAEVAQRWYVTATALGSYRGLPLDETEIQVARSNAPIGALAFVAPLLVVLTFAAWRWAEGARRPAPVRSLAPVLFGVAALLLAGGYIALNQLIRKDLGAETRGSGSNEDLIAFVTRAHSSESSGTPLVGAAASASAAAGADGPSATAEPVVIEDEVWGIDGTGAVKFTIALPPGFRKVTRRRAMTECRWSLRDESYPMVLVQIELYDPKTFEEAVAERERLQHIILKKERFAGGWLLATQKDEDEILQVMVHIESKSAPLTCFGVTKGKKALANRDAELAVLEKACRSVRHKTPANNSQESK